MNLLRKFCLGQVIFLFLLPRTFAGTAPVVPVAPKMNTFTISLPSNPSTGYSWSVVNYDKKLIKFIKQKYQPPKKDPKLIGMGGITNFYFSCLPKIKRPASTDVELKYARPWEKNSGKITKVVVVFTK
ncbi:MAG: hypothetical protein A3F18_02635 [Legionellales bacterium RIFCSPHIGHO2_12_FULL_37_14]|nr:MAG: hypothetical protein A3F18_02635 [Legionellales bacterium RIFCSPHIGHO2_12_FULL_37_14]